MDMVGHHHPGDEVMPLLGKPLPCIDHTRGGIQPGLYSLPSLGSLLPEIHLPRPGHLPAGNAEPQFGFYLGIYPGQDFLR